MILKRVCVLTYSQLNDGGTESRDKGGGVNDVHAVGKHRGHPRSRQGERGPDEGPASPVPYEEARDEASEKGSQKGEAGHPRTLLLGDTNRREIGG